MALTDPQGKVRFPVTLEQGDDFEVEVLAVPQGYLMPAPAVQDAMDVRPGEVRSVPFRVDPASAIVEASVLVLGADGTPRPVAGVEIVIRLK